MVLPLLVASLFALVTLVALVGRSVRGDGYGTTPPPSGEPWSAGDLPSMPYRNVR